MRNFRFHVIHRYGPWHQPEIVEETRATGDFGDYGTFKVWVQKRICSICQKEDWRKL